MNGIINAKRQSANQPQSSLNEAKQKILNAERRKDNNQMQEQILIFGSIP